MVFSAMRLGSATFLLAAVLVFPSLSIASDVTRLIAQGNEAFDHRAEKAQGLVADVAMISQALELFQQALKQDPQHVEARWKLLRAIIFKGHYALTDMAQKKKLFELGKSVADEGIRLMDQRIQADTGKSPDALSAEDRAAVLRKYPGTAELYYYAGTVWAEWSQAYGVMSAVKKGSASKIRDYAAMCALIDEQARYGGGYRTQGRLHHKCPKVPFVTGWINRNKGIEFLEKAYRIDPKRKFNRVYLAEGLYDLEPSRRGEAKTLLKQVIADAPDADLWVEDLNLQDEAKKDLKEWGGS